MHQSILETMCRMIPATCSSSIQTPQEPTGMKRVSFCVENDQVIAVERIDASLIQDLFYCSADFRRFRQEHKRSRRASTGSVVVVSSDVKQQEQDLNVRRERFQQLVAKRTQKIAENKATCAPRRGSLRASGERLALQNMRRQVAASA